MGVTLEIPGELQFHHEYERKFLPKWHALTAAGPLPSPTRLFQFYLELEPRQIRVRLEDGTRAYLEIKEPGHLESEKVPMDYREAADLTKTSLAPGTVPIEKVRHVIPAGFDGLNWEIDIYKKCDHWADSYGLVVIEIEVPSPDYVLPVHLLPRWLGPEVTNDPRFKNKNLAQRPFSTWGRGERQAVWSQMGIAYGE